MWVRSDQQPPETLLPIHSRTQKLATKQGTCLSKPQLNNVECQGGPEEGPREAKVCHKASKEARRATLVFSKVICVAAKNWMESMMRRKKISLGSRIRNEENDKESQLRPSARDSNHNLKYNIKLGTLDLWILNYYTLVPRPRPQVLQ